VIEGTVIFPPVSFRLTSRLRLSVATLLLLLSTLYPVNAVESVNIHLGNLSGPGWQLEGISLEILWQGDQGAQFSLTVSRITSTKLPLAMQSIRIECQQGAISDQQVRCDRGVANLDTPLLDNKQIALGFDWDRESQHLDLRLEKVAFSGGYASVQASWNGERWQARINGIGLSLARLLDRAEMLAIPIPEIDIAGQIDLDLHATGSSQGLGAAEWKIVFRDTGFADGNEVYLAEALSGRWSGRLQPVTGVLTGTQRLSLDAGAILTPLFYLAPEDRPVTMETEFRLTTVADRLEFDRLKYHHPGVLEFSADGAVELLDGPVLANLNLATRQINLQSLFDAYLAPVLTAPFFEQFRLSGQLGAELTLDPAPGLRLNLQNVGLEQGDGSGKKNILVHGLSGDLSWNPGHAASDSVLSWQGARLFQGIEIGAAQALLQLTDRGLTLRQPLRLPVMDGYLQAEEFELEATDSGPRLAFRGYLTPISMEQVSRAAGWPTLAGELSGVIPAVSYQNDMLQVDGIMLIRAFDGRILIRDLRLDDLFGPLPMLGADIEFQALDLETLTGTFSFGKITGKLEGRVDGLRLENWEPVAFDARFATPDDDDSRHRISQKAVDNISNLGGVGMSGALSRSFLRVFEEFGYDRIGISCRLEKGICEMGGVGPAERGYYLVRGGGIPRIDIVGFNRSTDWNVLISKLKQIAAGGAPVVE